MDIISHALVGNVFKEFDRSHSLRDKLVIVFFAFLADIPVMFLMNPLLGYEHGRPFWIPHDSDWVGARSAHPIWSMSWEIPHSDYSAGILAAAAEAGDSLLSLTYTARSSDPHWRMGSEAFLSLWIYGEWVYGCVGLADFLHGCVMGGADKHWMGGTFV
jgi:hypothetical protein